VLSAKQGVRPTEPDHVETRTIGGRPLLLVPMLQPGNDMKNAVLRDRLPDHRENRLQRTQVRVW